MAFFGGYPPTQCRQQVPRLQVPGSCIGGGALPALQAVCGRSAGTHGGLLLYLLSLIITPSLPEKQKKGLIFPLSFRYRLIACLAHRKFIVKHLKFDKTITKVI